jgi:Reverse transcriptase (RNA-dependent DNA polymerase)
LAALPSLNTAAAPSNDPLLSVIMPKWLSGGIITKSKPRALVKLHIIPKPDALKVRVIVDCSQLNVVKPCRFRLPQPRKVLETLGDTNTKAIASIDLKAAFHAFPVPPDFGFEFENSAYTFLRLPMGCRHAPFVLSKITDYVAKRVRELKGITMCVPYMDDFLIGSNGTVDLNDIISFIETSGFIVNRNKSDKKFSRETDWIGLTFSIDDEPTYKLSKLTIINTLALADITCQLTLKQHQAIKGYFGYVAQLIPGGWLRLTAQIDNLKNHPPDKKRRLRHPYRFIALVKKCHVIKRRVKPLNKEIFCDAT